MNPATEFSAQARARALCWIAAGFIVGLVGSYYLLTNKVLKNSGQAEEVAAAYRKAGFAWTAREVRPDLPVKREDDAWPLLNEVSRTFDPVKFEKNDQRLRQELSRSPDSVSRGFQYQVLVDSGNVALLKPACAKSKLSLDHDYDLGAELEYREAPLFKGIVGFLCLRAAILTRNQENSKAIAELEAAWKLSDLLAQEPLPFDRLVLIHCRELVLRQAQECVVAFRQDPELLRRLDRVLGNEAPIDLAASLRGQAYLNLAFVRNLDRAGRANTGIVRTGLPKSKEDRALAADTMREWLSLKPLMDCYRDDPIQLATQIDARAYGRKERNVRTRMLGFEYLGPDVVAMLKCEAETVATRALLEALAAFPNDAHLPNSITQVPGNWIDPFSGKPLVLRRTDQSLAIWSAGLSSPRCAGLTMGTAKSPLREAFIAASYLR